MNNFIGVRVPVGMVAQPYYHSLFSLYMWTLIKLALISVVVYGIYRVCKHVYAEYVDLKNTIIDTNYKISKLYTDKFDTNISSDLKVEDKNEINTSNDNDNTEVSTSEDTDNVDC